MGLSKQGWARSALQLLPTVAVAASGVILTYFGYLWGLLSPNPAEVLGPLLFYAAAVFGLLTLPLRSAARAFARSIRTGLGMAVFAGYLAAHLILYGFLLEEILVASYGNLLGTVTSGTYVFTDVFYPPSLTSVLFELSYNPSIVFNVSPMFTDTLSFYSIAVAFIIAMLVVANVAETRKIGKLCSPGKRARAFVLVPALGLVLGASCCLSVAGLVSLYTLPLAVTAELSSSITIYYVTYFLLPAFAVVILYLNLRSVEKAIDRLAALSSARSPA